MKTTIDIAEAVLVEAKALAKERETTLRALIEDGLRKVIAEDSERRTAEPYVYEPVTVRLDPAPGIDLSDPRTIKELSRGRY